MASSYDTMNMNEDEDGIIMYDDDHEHDHDHEHHHHNLSRLSVCTTNSSKHSMYDEGGDDDMMMFMSNLSIDCDADEEQEDDDEEEEDEEIVSGGVSSDSDKESTCVSLPGTPQRRAGVGSVEKIISHEKQYSSENEGLNKGGEKKIRKNSRRRIVRERWLDEAWEEKRCKAKALMDHEEDMMMMMDQSIHHHHNGCGRRGSLCIDLEEVKACRDLGFEFEVPSRISMSCSNLDTGSSGGNSPIANWKISSPGDDPKDVKARLKVWAQAVAMASASRFLG